MAKNISDRYRGPTGKVRQLPLTDARKRAFLAELERHGIAAEAARVASGDVPRDRHGGMATFRAARARDPVFAAEWDRAVEEADAKLLREARRRAVEGTERSIFQKGQRATDFDGKPATEKVYSDRLMELLLKARFPADFVERKQVEHTGSVAVGQPGVLSLSVDDVLLLNETDRAALGRLLERIAINRGERDGEAEPAMRDVTPRPVAIEGKATVEPDDGPYAIPPEGF